MERYSFTSNSNQIKYVSNFPINAVKPTAVLYTYVLILSSSGLKIVLWKRVCSIDTTDLFAFDASPRQFLIHRIEGTL